ncbi:MAG: CvpA family protein [Mediterranea sp.]|jgi:membrane protein required for colicin V production|nr:CvpA family protein [Mediterranea sp.]
MAVVTDIVIVICIVIGAGIGFKKGLIWQIVAIIGLVVGFNIARHLYMYVAEKYIDLMTSSFTTAKIIAFIGIWVIISLIFSFAGMLLTKIFDAALLGCFNRSLGAALGIVKYMLLIGIVIHALDYFDIENRVLSRNKKEASLFYYPLKTCVGRFFPVITKLREKVIIEQEDQKSATDGKA